MKKLVVFLLTAAAACASAALWAQVTGPGQSSAQVADVQRRAELRRILHQKQSAETAQRQLNAQERAELRNALRQQRAGQIAATAAQLPGSTRP